MFFFFKQKTAYEMRISDWSSDVCSSDLKLRRQCDGLVQGIGMQRLGAAQHGSHRLDGGAHHVVVGVLLGERDARSLAMRAQHRRARLLRVELLHDRSEEHTSELQSLMRISYAVFCLKKKKRKTEH